MVRLARLIFAREYWYFRGASGAAGGQNLRLLQLFQLRSQAPAMLPTSPICHLPGAPESCHSPPVICRPSSTAIPWVLYLFPTPRHVSVSLSLFELLLRWLPMCVRLPVRPLPRFSSLGTCDPQQLHPDTSDGVGTTLPADLQTCRPLASSLVWHGSSCPFFPTLLVLHWS